MKDFDDRRAQVQAKLADFIRLFDTPWSLPPELQAILAKQRSILTDAQNKLAAKDVEGARGILLGPDKPEDHPAPPGLEASLVINLKRASLELESGHAGGPRISGPTQAPSPRSPVTQQRGDRA